MCDEEQKEENEENHLASGFVRSDRNIMMRQRDQIEQAKVDLENEKIKLV